MAKNFIKPRKHDTGKNLTTKTPYGTTGDMVINDEKILSKIKCPDNFVLVKDVDGYYFTQKNRVDSGLADPNRYDVLYRKSVSDNILSQLND